MSWISSLRRVDRPSPLAGRGVQKRFCNTAKQRGNQHRKIGQGQRGHYAPGIWRWWRRREHCPSCRRWGMHPVVGEEELALLFRLWSALLFRLLVGAVVPNLAPCRWGASRRPISQGGICVDIISCCCCSCAGCNSTRCPDSQQGIPAAPCTLSNPQLRLQTRDP